MQAKQDRRLVSGPTLRQALTMIDMLPESITAEVKLEILKRLVEQALTAPNASN